MEEHFFDCPKCWETISMLFDPSLKNSQYFEDCEVCCNPIEATVSFENAELTLFSAESIEQ